MRQMSWNRFRESVKQVLRLCPEGDSVCVWVDQNGRMVTRRMSYRQPIVQIEADPESIIGVYDKSVTLEHLREDYTQCALDRGWLL